MGFLLCSLLAFTQPVATDTVAVLKGDTVIKANPFHSPRKATILSALLPGAGQIYNKQYWKAPLVWGAIGISAYYLNFNQKNYNHYKKGYITRLDTIPGNELSEFNTTSTSTLEAGMSFYRRYRDISYACVAIFYILNIVDASVGAHLFYFNVSEDISLNVQPYQPMTTQPGYGLRLTLNF